MNLLTKVSGFVGKNLTWLVLATIVGGYFVPGAFSWSVHYTVWLLGVVMFGMGMTLHLSDFKLVLQRPKEVLAGTVCHYTIMPLVAFALTKVFHLSPDLAVDMKKLGERTITIDCDVLQGDGGTRTASVTGGFVALSLALHKLVMDGVLPEMPLTNCVAAVSAGIVGDEPMLDLCYEEDSHAQVDLNCVMTGAGELVELQGTGEGRPFTIVEQRALVELCAKGIRELQNIQRQVLGG